jgi:hypothetical protein
MQLRALYTVRFRYPDGWQAKFARAELVWEAPPD